MNSNITTGNKTIVTHEIPVEEYSGIELSTAGEVLYRQAAGEAPYLEIITDENIFSLLVIQVVENRLVIKTKGGATVSPSQLTIHTNSSKLKDIKIDGSGKVVLTGEITSENMNMEITGSGKIEGERVNCRKSDLKITGPGTITLKGTGENLSCSIIGSGKIHMYEYMASKVTCKTTGSGEMEIYAGEELTSRTRGSGNVRYKGYPVKKNITNSGSGRTIQME
ncbi:MAG: DUF2807 domain-containing protein [Candidatus Azobacteroides sp.]|nr:DUF2807 domain-containing protein [Candidatus Azobacteroides sp.]